ncbi:MAG TPA: DEAD/DEAH box helicase [Actinomycetota bacterium]|nr:DEAD/DEAH box helicase [Actinomycetota bacterium]
MLLEDLLQKLSSELESEGLLHLARIPARDGVTKKPNPPLPGTLRRRLGARGIDALWTHQADALDFARAGEHVIVSTGTASGKSLCFNLPVIEKILETPRARALYLYPTKALAQDQLRSLRTFALPQVRAATYDGDTPKEEREGVRKYANIVLSNPDMLHFGLLPLHQRWTELLANLAFVVVDEAHVLRGIFGSHVGCILRRLRRLALHYGSDPVFILTSATMGNPGTLAEHLLGMAFKEISEDGAPRGERLFAFWNPPFIDEEKGVRGSANWEAARLLSSFVDEDVKTIAFAKSRKSAELVAKYARTLLQVAEEDQIRPYRAGYLAAERRQIEQELFSGKLKGVASTSALELGIDVGGMDAVVLNGFPGTVSAVWQRAGRAGRHAEQSAAVLIGQDDPLDQYYMHHPEVLLGKPFEVALVDTTNPNVLAPHLGAAVYEQPLEVGSADEIFGKGAESLAEEMVQAGDMAVRKQRATKIERYHWKRQQPPGRDLDIRSLGGAQYAIVEESTGALLGTVDGARAFQQIHPGAVYLHQGDNFEVASLDLETKVALVKPLEGNYYTQSRESSDIRVIEPFHSKTVGTADFYVGKVEVTEHVVAFVRRDISTGETLAIVDLDLPPNILETVAFWYTVVPGVVQRAEISPADLPGSLHAAEHAGIGILPLFAMADRWDIGGVSTALSGDTGLPTVFIYDGYPGGAGIAQRGFDEAGEHLAATLQAVRDCQCDSGCPSCVQSPKCGNGNEPLDKHGAIRLMSAILTGTAY